MFAVHDAGAVDKTMKLKLKFESSQSRVECIVDIYCDNKVRDAIVLLDYALVVIVRAVAVIDMVLYISWGVRRDVGNSPLELEGGV